jgi:hypothetical protein
MRRFVVPVILIFCGGCFTSRPGAESAREKIRKGMHKEHVRAELGPPKEITPIPGQGENKDVPTEQWTYVYAYTQGKIFTILLTAFIGLFFMDFNHYGFDVGFGRDGRVLTVTEVGPRRKDTGR